MPPDTITKCGYLYNRYTATAGSGVYGAGMGGNVIQGSICPAGWHLPRAFSGTTIDSTDQTFTNADFAVLNASMNANTYTTPGVTTSYPAGWQPTGSFAGVFSGYFSGALFSQGSYSYMWSSTTTFLNSSQFTRFNSSIVYPGQFGTGMEQGYAVRCVL
jgi:uncharacterized protein (TIGR02145 family)